MALTSDEKFAVVALLPFVFEMGQQGLAKLKPRLNAEQAQLLSDLQCLVIKHQEA